MGSINRGYKFRLYTSDEVVQRFAQWAGATRATYNCALQQIQWFGRDVKLGYVEQARQLKDLRAEFDWIKDVPQQCLQQALRDLHGAFARFFAGASGYPRRRRKFQNDSFRFPGRDADRIRVLNRKWAEVLLPKVGAVKFRLSRTIPPGVVKNVTLVREANGWHIVFSMEVEHDVPENTLPSVGIDRGVVNHVALSTGQLMSMPANDLERQYRRAQQAHSRKRRGSRRYARARRRVTTLAARAARARLHWQHVTTTQIVREYGRVVIEDLKVRNMTASAKGTVEAPGRNVAAKAGLNRSILAASWYQYGTLLEYKLTAAGGALVLVNPAYTSLTCSNCGSIDKANRESQARFCCVHCGHEAHADVNAAINILRAGTQPAPDHRRELKRAA